MRKSTTSTGFWGPHGSTVVNKGTQVPRAQPSFFLQDDKNKGAQGRIWKENGDNAEYSLNFIKIKENISSG